MKISTESNHQSWISLIVVNGSTTISETVSGYYNGSISVPESDIEMLITAANDLSRFNGVTDVDFLKKIYDAYLSDNEKIEFLNLIDPQP